MSKTPSPQPFDLTPFKGEDESVRIFTYYPGDYAQRAEKTNIRCPNGFHWTPRFIGGTGNRADESAVADAGRTNQSGRVLLHYKDINAVWEICKKNAESGNTFFIHFYNCFFDESLGWKKFSDVPQTYLIVGKRMEIMDHESFSKFARDLYVHKHGEEERLDTVKVGHRLVLETGSTEKKGKDFCVWQLKGSYTVVDMQGNTLMKVSGDPEQMVAGACPTYDIYSKSQVSAALQTAEDLKTRRGGFFGGRKKRLKQ